MREFKVKRARTVPSRLGLRKKPQAEIGAADRELSDQELHAVVAAGSDDSGNAQGDSYSSIENVNGSTADDIIIGNAAANVLNGWAGKDTLTGGGGADTFAFSQTNHSAVGANADVITDFSHAQGDKIDLSAIDADTTVAGNQAFTFIGTGLYNGDAGELRYTSNGAVTTVAGDVNGDGVSDFHIQLTGSIGLVAADFVL